MARVMSADMDERFDIVDMKFEVTVLPVGDAERAKTFYQKLGWRLDADIAVDDGYRVIQFTPPNSPASIQFGKGMTALAPGSVKDLMLIVEDVEAARQELMGHGVEVSEVWHGPGVNSAGRREPGPDPEHGSYSSWASFADPDGNTWLLQEVTERRPGRVWSTDVAALAGLLHETSEHHGAFEAVAPPHDWWDWYAAYLDARQGGANPEAASAAAGRYMAEVKHVVV
ncbi:VOC family protein [Nonomuraea sediminis]|uniref:VOC family protein n=1 Tax=Nonomuraea sediminis TaxID=2835864 RepID=UPI0027E0BA12|nr:VOC family protein [Nonomuraea sediminis]